MTEFYNSPIYWAWSLFLSISWLAQGAFIAQKPVNYCLRLWWIIFLNGLLLTASLSIESLKSIKEGSFFDGVFYGLSIPIAMVVAVATALILQHYTENKDN